MAKYSVSWDVNKKDNNFQPMLYPAWKLANELGLVFPLFIAVFFPRAKLFYHKFLRNLTEEIPTWSHQLYLHNASKANFSSETKWKGICVTWDDYKIIHQRWQQFDTIKKNLIKRQNKRLLEIYPFLSTAFMLEERKRLFPYVGLTVQFFGELYKLGTYKHYQTGELKCSLTVVDIRFSLEKENVLTTHFNFPISPKAATKYLKNAAVGDTVRFNALVDRYENPLYKIERVELNNLEILEIIQKED